MKFQYFLKSIPPTIKFSILILIGIAVSSIPIVMFWQTKPKQEVSKSQISVQKFPKSNPVSTLGRIEPKKRIIRLFAPTANQFPRVEKLIIKEGDIVKVGQVVAVLDNYKVRQAELNQAENQVKVTTARLAQIKAGAKTGEIQSRQADIERVQAQLQGDMEAQKEVIKRLSAQLQGDREAQEATIRRLKADFENAESEYKRNEQLFKEGAISSSLFDSKSLSVETTKQQLREAQAVLNRINTTGNKQLREAQAVLNRINTTGNNQLKGAKATFNSAAEVRPVEVNVAQMEVDAAISAVKLAKSQLDLAYVHTPVAGQILKVNTQPGELVSTTGIADIGNTDEMYVVAEVYETDIRRVKVGQSAEITSPAIDGKLFGKVEEIGWQIGKRQFLGTDPGLNVDAKVIELKIRLEPDDSKKVVKLSNLEVNALIRPE
ncbi:MAG: ABC exporter membrane fusion protein [Nostocales cyanobacterium LacPavin_0920_SED1_MAG_38_18]|nr:ABC exporter membrane fusion protein [Nostocales cyanobacterium LacPavin_0920_SED1_MAG_38_18]